MLQYGGITAQFCENYFSDHSPIQIEIISDGASTSKSIRLIHVLADADGFMQTVEHQWSAIIHGTCMFRLWKKLQLRSH